MFFAALAYKAMQQLDKILCLSYVLGVAIVAIIGFTHLFNPIIFRSLYHYTIYVIEMICYAFGFYKAALRFKDHMLTQHEIRTAI